MRRLLPLLLLAGGCHLALDPGSIPAPLARVEIAYSGFTPGCVVLTASKPGGPTLQAESIQVPAGSRAGVLVAVLYAPGGSPEWLRRQDDLDAVIQVSEAWGNQLVISAAANERSCQGQVVASGQRAVTLSPDRVISLQLELNAIDADQDGYVRAPAGTDCDDADHSVQPRGSGELLCDGKDDDCSGGVDDTFLVGAACSPAGGCGGAIACAPGAPGESTICAPLAVRQYWVDSDGDGFGGPDAGFTCRPDAGMVLVPGDCDDTLAYVYPDAGEICDRLDDNCNGVTDDIPGQRCDRILVPALIAPPQSPAGPRMAMAGVGRVVVVGGDGGVAYVESDGGVLWRGGVCPGDWYSAWVNRADDRVYLGGATGALGSLDRTSLCTTQTYGPAYYLALWGQPDAGPNPSINLVNTGAEYRTWLLPSALANYGVQVTPCCGNLRGLDGRPNGVMMTAGWLYDGVQRHARVLRSPGQGQAFVDTRLEDALVDAGRGTYQAALHDVTFPRDDLAYAAGENSLLARWNGTAWTVLPPVSPTWPVISSVVAFDEQNVYLATGNFILRWDGSGYRTVVFAPNVVFGQVRGSSPDDLWAVANGQVWHFSAGP